MTTHTKPGLRPANPNFSSGPCAKRPGWSVEALKAAALGRSHRAKISKTKLEQAIALTREILQVPANYRIGIVPASDTGAVEMALWSLLGERGVDMVAWESFGSGWITDVVKQLKLADVRKLEAGYGELPDLGRIDFDRDVVFTWNGTTSGVRVPNGDFIPAGRKGLTICDATSAAFAQKLDFEKLDVVTFSWQKVLGGEGAHGMLILSPRAVERLESYKPAWPLPKIFRLTSGGKLIEGIFKGETINTPSMLCVEDYLDALNWAKSIGGLDALVARADANAAVLDRFVAKSSWLGHLAVEPATRSNTSVCLSFTDGQVAALDADAQAAFAKGLVSALDKEGVAYDIGSYRDAPPGLRIWCGATVETSDLEALLPWLDWAFAAQKALLKAAA
ncbi:phosphoserine transaminase [Mesorhizobium sp. B292B1B]|uniref:phosphoserine transaminase n=1 Tax=unclassified Mesorhizobium TaxID=325217 RepID=UPI00112B5963|nr:MULTISPECIES: phosphoserine transaminase [unclassified Mesorhizobium]MCA0011467.1 phosphoserine transaminase [Mesorhizobium sp. B294B1A1]MCA0036961.1 phosphoserine transaminase [Mesorhizobium sp. B292B1B]TPM46943.1 phosphoserine transaminase [Mesorhizobium sp. B2-3-2]